MTSTCLQAIAELRQRKPVGPDLGRFPENRPVPEFGAELRYISSKDVNGDGFCQGFIYTPPGGVFAPPRLKLHTPSGKRGNTPPGVCVGLGVK
jgi:hypothetical protein